MKERLCLHKNFFHALDGRVGWMLSNGNRIVEHGSGEAPALQADQTTDHAGQILSPLLTDAHCHILPAGLDLIRPRIPHVVSDDQAIDFVRQANREYPDGWLIISGYDQNVIGRHLNRDDLDGISLDRPIVVRHVSGHALVANSPAITLASVAHNEVDPSGGTIGRLDDGRINGIFFEQACDRIWRAIPSPSVPEMRDAILAACASMRRLGIGSAADMNTGTYGLRDEIEAYAQAAEAGAETSITLYVQWSRVFTKRGQSDSARDVFDRLSSVPATSCRIGGIKLFADGAIGSGTAAIYGSYIGDGKGGARISNRGRDASAAVQGASGQLIYERDELISRVRIASEAGYSVAVHSIGDAAVDLVMDAFEATGDPNRHRIEHAMILSDVQIERIARLGCRVVVQPEFLAHFGLAYQRQLGAERASRLKRLRSLIEAGVPVAFSSDRPIVPGNPVVGIRTAARRPEGFDPCENITLHEAFEAYTWQAEQACSAAQLMGRLYTGDPANFASFAADAFD